MLFAMNELLMVSDGTQARVGTLTAGREWFKPWRTISGEALADPHLPQLQVATEGLLDRRRFLELIRDFMVFEDADGEKLLKKMAGYHQFYAVQAAVGETLRAAELELEADGVAEGAGRYEAGRKPGGKPGDRRIGVVWHVGVGAWHRILHDDQRHLREVVLTTFSNPTTPMISGG